MDGAVEPATQDGYPPVFRSHLGVVVGTVEKSGGAVRPGNDSKDPAHRSSFLNLVFCPENNENKLSRGAGIRTDASAAAGQNPAGKNVPSQWISLLGSPKRETSRMKQIFRKRNYNRKSPGEEIFFALRQRFIFGPIPGDMKQIMDPSRAIPHNGLDLG
jgi:hypothetical protein